MMMQISKIFHSVDTFHRVSSCLRVSGACLRAAQRGGGLPCAGAERLRCIVAGIVPCDGILRRAERLGGEGIRGALGVGEVVRREQCLPAVSWLPGRRLLGAVRLVRAGAAGCAGDSEAELSCLRHARLLLLRRGAFPVEMAPPRLGRMAAYGAAGVHACLDLFPLGNAGPGG